MKAPDKLYLHPNYKGEVGANWLAFSLTKEDECYIRKDALLEWASQRREAVAKEVVIQEGVRLGADAAFEELLDKLNEM